MGGLLSFLGGSAFRMIWGEVSAWMTRRQEHAQEVERMQLQERLDAAQHARNMDAIKVQAELGVKEIRVKAEAALEQTEMDAWLDAVKATSRKSGVPWVDAWNQGIRPAGATAALVMIAGEVVAAGFVISGDNRDVLYAFLGLFIADRSLAKRGK